MSTASTPSTQPPTHPSQPTHQQSTKGIDVHQALNILSARGHVGHDDHNQHQNHPNHSPSAEGTGGRGGSGCGCCGGDPVPDNTTGMGQTIDLLSPNNKDEESSKNPEMVDAAMKDKELEDQRKQLEEERTKRRKEIQEELNAMSVRELLQQVMKAQQGRVATYREYESGLKSVLQTGNMTTYPETCAKATASFSVLSDSIKMVQEILAGGTKQRKDLAQLLGQLQSHEKEKLYVTAACHLERIRQRNHELREEVSSTSVPGSSIDETKEGAANTAAADPRISRLLREGVASLQQKIATSVESINEILEELRCAILEEDEETS